MIYENLLDKIGFDPEIKEVILSYQDMIGREVEVYSKKYMCEKMPMSEVLNIIHQFKNDKLSEYTVDMIFLLNSTGYLYDQYMKMGISEEIFINTMKDILYKVKECIKLKGITGTFTVAWYDGFFRLNRLGLGRLQYDICPAPSKKVELIDYTIDENDFSLGCHIPSSGSLSHEICIKSYKMAYEMFKNRLKNGILPIKCTSWLLYPPYVKVFRKASPNIFKFISDFEISEINQQEKFYDAWRIFYAENYENTGDLPDNTKLQREMKKYIDDNGIFGAGSGVILFDGNKIITQNQYCK